MLNYLVPALVLIFSLGAIFFILVKKIPSLSTLNTESLVEEKESKTKNRLIINRLNRKVSAFSRLAIGLGGPVADKVRLKVNDFYQKIIELERTVLEKTRPLKSVDIKQEALEKLTAARQLFDQSRLDLAEETYIKVINLDPKNLDAYQGLAQVYLTLRDYKKARETCRYYLKLLNRKSIINDSGEGRSRLASCYADLGSIYQLENRNQLALANFNKAVELESNNPRFLDFLLKISIILKHKELAQKTFAALKEADPDNQKLPELQEEINGLPEMPVAPSSEKSVSPNETTSQE